MNPALLAGLYFIFLFGVARFIGWAVRKQASMDFETDEPRREEQENK